jgi:glycosyltransferase involved in cell wall biosynthesis
VICVCDFERRLALEKRIAPAERLLVVYNGVRDVPVELRSHPEDAPARIVSVARLEAPKDQATLLEALARLRPLAWRLDLAGDGPREQEMRALAKRLGVAERVHFHGYLPDPAPLLARAQVFALASRSEGLPRSILEAMRAGLPVVATDVGGVSEAVADGVSGSLVPRDDPEALSQALASLLAEPSRRARLGAAARRTYESRFRLERMVETTAGIYDTVVVGTSQAPQAQ